jgi:hypothetical protein
MESRTAAADSSDRSQNQGALHVRSRGASASSATAGRGEENLGMATGAAGVGVESDAGDFMSVSTAFISHGGYTSQRLTRTALTLEGVSSPDCSPTTATAGLSAQLSSPSSQSMGSKASPVVVGSGRAEAERSAAGLEVPVSEPEVLTAAVEDNESERRASWRSQRPISKPGRFLSRQGRLRLRHRILQMPSYHT